METVFVSCEKEFLSKKFKVRAAKFKGNVTSLKKLGIKVSKVSRYYDFNVAQIKAEL